MNELYLSTFLLKFFFFFLLIKKFLCIEVGNSCFKLCFNKFHDTKFRVNYSFKYFIHENDI